MAYRARFAQAGHVTDTPGPSGVPGSRPPVQPPEVRTGAFTRPVHAHMYMHTSSLYMYMRAPVRLCVHMCMYMCAHSRHADPLFRCCHLLHERACAPGRAMRA